MTGPGVAAAAVAAARKRPGGKAPKKDKPKSYDFAEPAGWATKVATLRELVQEDLVVLMGMCPRCEHIISVELPLAGQEVVAGMAADGVPTTSVLDVRTPANAPQTPPTYAKVARCNCRMKHEGRPDDVASGCGAFGLLELWLGS